MGSGNAVEMLCLCKRKIQHSKPTQPHRMYRKRVTLTKQFRDGLFVQDVLMRGVALEKHFGLKSQIIFCRKIPLRIIQSNPNLFCQKFFAIFAPLKVFNRAPR
jgi:hypothetical protein